VGRWPGVSRMRRISTGAAYADEQWVNTNPEVWRAGIPAAQVSKLGPLLFIFSIPLNAPGLKILCRPGEVTTQRRFDFPLSWYDEVDATIVFDDALVPWERLLSYRASTS
jgi:aromatic ring hydroxylase